MSAKKLDRQGRLRNKTVAFRVSPEEWELIGKAVELSGLTKQDYILQKLLDKSITVKGNPRIHRALKKEIEALLTELRRIEAGGEVCHDLQETIELIANTYHGIGS